MLLSYNAPHAPAPKRSRVGGAGAWQPTNRAALGCRLKLFGTVCVLLSTFCIRCTASVSRIAAAICFRITKLIRGHRYSPHSSALIADANAVYTSPCGSARSDLATAATTVKWAVGLFADRPPTCKKQQRQCAGISHQRLMLLSPPSNRRPILGPSQSTQSNSPLNCYPFTPSQGLLEKSSGDGLFELIGKKVVPSSRTK
jgi:hypothetical protein